MKKQKMWKIENKNIIIKLNNPIKILLLFF